MRAEQRKKLITRYLWDEKSGFFFDFNLQTGKRSWYRYATTFYPMWAGLATPEQAKALLKNLSTFEKPGGLAMSTEDSGAQWDLPYGWGNIEMLAIEGLRRYGFNADQRPTGFPMSFSPWWRRTSGETEISGKSTTWSHYFPRPMWNSVTG